MTGLRIGVATNVPPPVLRPYLMPLLDLPEVSEVVLIRDKADVDGGPKLRVVTPPAWWPLGIALKIAARRFLFWWVGRTRRPDIVMLIHWFPDGPAITRWARRLGAPLVVNIVGGPAEIIDGGRRIALWGLPGRIKAALESYQRRWLNRATVVTVTGEKTREWYKDRGITKPVVALHAAVEPVSPTPADADRTVDVVFVGRPDADKRIDRCFRVLHSIARQRRGVSATVVGVSDADAMALESYRGAQGALGPNLLVFRRVESILALLSRAKVLLITSDTEGRTLAALEAFACGAAVVATAVGDLEEAIAGSGGGVTVQLGPDEERVIDELANSVVHLLTSEPKRAAMAARGRAFLVQAHSAERSREDWRTVLRVCAAQGRH